MDFVDYLSVANQSAMQWVIGLCLFLAVLGAAVFLAWRRSYARRQHELKQQLILPSDFALKTQALKETLSADAMRGTIRNTNLFMRMGKAYTVCFFAALWFLISAALFLFDAVEDPHTLWDGSDSCVGMWLLAALAIVSFLAARKTYRNARYYRRMLSETKG